MPRQGPSPRPPRGIFGDFNLSFTEVQALAKECGGEAVRGHGPDHAIVIGAKVVHTHVLGKHGSDAHHVILFDLEADEVPVRVMLWNVWVGQRPRSVRRSLRRLTRRHRPDVVVLNEAYRCVDALQGVEGYTAHQGANVGEGADVAVLVANRHQVKRTFPLRMRESWTVVSKRRLKGGRQFRGVRVNLDVGPVLPVLGIHFPTDHPINAAAVDESIRRVAQWAN